MPRKEGMAPIAEQRQEEVRRGQDPIDDSLRPRTQDQQKRRAGLGGNGPRFFINAIRDGNGGGNGGGGNGNGGGNGGGDSDDDKKDDDDQHRGKKNNSNGDKDRDRFEAAASPPSPPPTPTIIFSASPSTVTMPPSTVVIVSTLAPSPPPSPPPPPPPLTITKSTSTSTSTSALPPVRPSNTQVVNNPLVGFSPIVSPSASSVVSTFIPLMTTTPIADPLSSRPRKGVDGPQTTMTSTSSSTTTTESSTSQVTTTSIPLAFQDNLPTPTITVINVGSGQMNNGGQLEAGKGSGPRGGLSPVAEDVLISVGSIGAFILISFIVWLIWRTMKKSKAKKNGYDNGHNFRAPNQLLGRIPFLNRAQGGWHNMDDSGSVDLRGAPPSYEKESMLMDPQTQGYYSVNKTNPTLPPTQRQQEARSQGNTLPQLQTNFIAANTINSSSIYSPQPGNALSPSGTAQMVGTLQSTGTSGISPSRSLMPDPFFNQSELARQPSDAYDPARRQVYRASELSSISSGFGDGDIIMPALPQTASHALRQSNNMVGRFSWQTRKSVVTDSNRDTMYTQSSEDMPPRFRTVDSWVNQQSGRVQRAGQRTNAPPVPALPPMERFTMMMDDGEVPRRPGT